MNKVHAKHLIVDTGLQHLEPVVDVSPIGPPPPGMTDGYWDIFIDYKGRRIQISDSEENPHRYYVGVDQPDDLHGGNMGFTVEVGRTDVKSTVLMLIRGEFVFS